MHLFNHNEGKLLAETCTAIDEIILMSSLHGQLCGHPHTATDAPASVVFTSAFSIREPLCSSLAKNCYLTTKYATKTAKLLVSLARLAQIMEVFLLLFNKDVAQQKARPVVVKIAASNHSSFSLPLSSLWDVYTLRENTFYNPFPCFGLQYFFPKKPPQCMVTPHKKPLSSLLLLYKSH